jgi:phosphoglycolate phosphatase-like HAD superfamily hydrolase
MNDIRHIVWDWNGTLLDDTALTVRAAGAALAAIGVPRELTVEHWREIAVRPIYTTYTGLAGAELTPDQWRVIQDVWLATYVAGADAVGLNPAALAALDQATALGMTQSIVSLHKEDVLHEHAADLGIADRFTAISGTRGPWTSGNHSKAGEVRHQLSGLGIDPAHALMIGDMVDDAHQARDAGVAVVLVPSGDTSLTRLVASGYPVAESLVAAVLGQVI